MNFIKAKSLARAFGQGRQVGGRCDIIKPPWIGFLHETWYIAWLRSLIRGKYILIAKILAYLNIKRDITFSQLKIRISQRRPIKVKTFKWISVTKIQYYPCRAIRGSEKSIKEKKNRLLSRAQLPSYLCMLQHRERGNNPLRVPSIFRCRDKVFTSKPTQQSIPEQKRSTHRMRFTVAAYRLFVSQQTAFLMHS